MYVVPPSSSKSDFLIISNHFTDLMLLLFCVTQWGNCPVALLTEYIDDRKEYLHIRSKGVSLEYDKKIIIQNSFQCYTVANFSKHFIIYHKNMCKSHWICKFSGCFFIPIINIYKREIHASLIFFAMTL